MSLGAMTPLAAVAADRAVGAGWPALARAAALVATPPLRNVATVGGNLCLDTRCTYYDQSEPWREAVGYCMKRDGDTCWVAPGSDRCWAVSSTDTAPVLCALGAEVSLRSKAGERRIPVSELFADDGIRHLALRPGEVLAAVHVPPPAAGERANYLKLRRRGSFDFPVLGVAARVRLGTGGTVESARIVLGGVGSRPQEARAAAEFLCGRRLADEETLREAARLASQVAKPLLNTDFALGWRKQMAREWTLRALRDLAA
jgi:4-hydroxybenzoyl-CoA reductase subunit beta